MFCLELAENTVERVNPSLFIMIRELRVRLLTSMQYNTLKTYLILDTIEKFLATPNPPITDLLRILHMLPRMMDLSENRSSILQLQMDHTERLYGRLDDTFLTKSTITQQVSDASPLPMMPIMPEDDALRNILSMTRKLIDVTIQMARDKLSFEMAKKKLLVDGNQSEARQILGSIRLNTMKVFGLILLGSMDEAHALLREYSDLKSLSIQDVGNALIMATTIGDVELASQILEELTARANSKKWWKMMDSVQVRRVFEKLQVYLDMGRYWLLKKQPEVALEWLLKANKHISREKALNQPERQRSLSSESAHYLIRFYTAVTLFKLHQQQQQQKAESEGDVLEGSSGERSTKYAHMGHKYVEIFLRANMPMISSATTNQPSSSLFFRWRKLCAEIELIADQLIFFAHQPDKFKQLSEALSQKQAERDHLEREHGFHTPEDEAIPLDELQRMLPDDIAILEMVSAERCLLEVLIKSKSIHVVIRDIAWHYSPIFDFHQGCSKPNGNWQKPGEELRSLLIDPFLPYLSDVKHIAIVTNERLQKVAFHALPFRETPENPITFLASRWTISYLPNTTILLHAKNQLLADMKREGSIVAGGAVSMRNVDPITGLPKSFIYLEQGKREVEYVGKCLGVPPIIGKECNKQALLSAIASHGDEPIPIVHIVTHCELVEDLPLCSYLTLSDGSNLTLVDLLGLKLDVGLFVLSACSSTMATGRTDSPNGFINALVNAGVRNVVGSMWPVLDDIAMRFMAKFYHNLHSGSRSSPSSSSSSSSSSPSALIDSLQAAQRAIMKNPFANFNEHILRNGEIPLEGTEQQEDGDNLVHPFYWAAFRIIDTTIFHQE
jgi:CHAT domain-containing protein